MVEVVLMARRSQAAMFAILGASKNLRWVPDGQTF